MTVPAHLWLWSDEDVLAGHARRYTVGSLRKVLETSGFQVEFLSTFFDFLTIPVLIGRAIPSRIGLSRSASRAQRVQTQHSAGAMSQKVLDVLCRRELARIAAMKATSLGASCLAVARNPD